ncbi:hypothetical protein GSH05_31800 [Burkholderia pseudomallei]|nr:hypothetical protein CXQ84_12025 [Burkholderia pseudomallei]KAA8767007.1 hypothetical protein F5D26_17060 [Burkholderia pseudomallei]MBG1247108.1 hypothetical protein [Burkholderia pseudomallei]MBK3336719.1 hypothetical protein [Burkholderia pseudomallei]MBM5589283.1 hypothetical protein [Burkholderia pseudomallei]
MRRRSACARHRCGRRKTRASERTKRATGCGTKHVNRVERSLPAHAAAYARAAPARLARRAFARTSMPSPGDTLASPFPIPLL